MAGVAIRQGWKRGAERATTRRMSLAHPLDRPAWSALATGWAHLARGDARALQLEPAFGPFAAAADRAPANMAALAEFEPGADGLWLVETEETEAPRPAWRSSCKRLSARWSPRPSHPVQPSSRLRP